MDISMYERLPWDIGDIQISNCMNGNPGDIRDIKTSHCTRGSPGT